jgi:hypothetical protein
VEAKTASDAAVNLASAAVADQVSEPAPGFFQLAG